MRRFEFQEGTSHKFWEVSVEREQLRGCEFPRLERLGLSLASDARPPDSRPLLQALGSLRAPLRELHLDGVDGIEEVLDGLATRDFLKYRQRFLPASYSDW